MPPSPNVPPAGDGSPRTPTAQAQATTPPRGGLLGLWDRVVRPGISDEELASRHAQAQHPPDTLDGKVIGLLVLASVCLTLLEYFGKSRSYPGFVAWIQTQTWLAELGVNLASFHPKVRLQQLLFWSTGCVVGYFVIPGLYVKLVMRERWRDMGLTWRGVRSHAWIYGLMFVVMAPLLWFFSASPSFQHTYPFYKVARYSLTGFLLWEFFYAAQFFSLEFFFRGVLIHGLKHRFGVYAVMVSVVPYCMIHFGKPFPETLGAIIAGTVLGFLSLRTGSVLLGVAIHVSVALSMDVLSLWRQGFLAQMLQTMPEAVRDMLRIVVI